MSSRWSECGEKGKIKKGPWTFDEDTRLLRSIEVQGHGRWNVLAKAAGLQRCGRSCRLRWVNYLRPGIKRGNITPEEEQTIIDLHNRWGSRWSIIAERIPGRTDNELKNYRRSHLENKVQNLVQAQNISEQNYYHEAQVQAKHAILPRKYIDLFHVNETKGPLSYYKNNNHVSAKVETPMDKLCMQEMSIDMEKVQVQVETSFMGNKEVEVGIQNDMGIVAHDEAELSRILYSFPSGIQKESNATKVFETSCFANSESTYSTHEREFDFMSDIMPWNMELDTPFLSSIEDFRTNEMKSPLLHDNYHNHA